jgi:hypothetical protein
MTRAQNIAAIVFCAVAAFASAQTPQQESTADLDRRVHVLIDAYWECPDLACKDAKLAKVDPMVKELDARYQAQLQAITQAIVGKRKP